MMLNLLLLSSVLVATYAQYPYQNAPGAPPQRHQQSYQQPPQQQQQSYQPPPQQHQQSYQPPPQQHQQSYQPPPQRNPIYNPAPVHYVNIGEQLAGDYKFGYDTGKANDGQSFREETRLPDGTVQGAYGYVDGSGRKRVVKYTAGKDGFKAEGDVGPDGVPQASSPGPAPQPIQRPQPQAYHPPQQSHAPQPAQQNYAPPRQAPPVYSQPQQYAPRPAPAQRSYNPQPYNAPDNDIGEPVDVVIDTSLLNYNIGASQQQSG